MAARRPWITAALKEPFRTNAAGAPGVLIHCVMCVYKHRLIGGAISDEGQRIMSDLGDFSAGALAPGLGFANTDVTV